MSINPGAYEPKVGRKFEYWTWPKTDYEMDHAGQFIETNRDEYVYSGGESKWSHTSTYPNNVSLMTTVVHDARDQVEERVRILDAVMNLGYYKWTIFTMRVFVLSQSLDLHPYHHPPRHPPSIPFLSSAP
jgi:hypothetical protein